MTDNDDVIDNEKNVKIFVRIFPFERFCKSCTKLDIERKKIYVRCLQDMQPNRISPPKKPSYWCFQTDGIFLDSSQEEVYRDSSEDLVLKRNSGISKIKPRHDLRILDGVSCVLMGYGQTGSGKSFTISGLRNNWEHRGLVTRLLSHMFVERTNRKNISKIEYCVSFVELYGRNAKDLLAGDRENRIKINERDPFKEISMVCLNNQEDGLKKIFEGEFRRSVAKGSTYPASHLATAVITFHVTNTSLITSWGAVTTAKMHVVEAAGTGTVGKNIYWKTATDIGMANLTKTQLEQFFSYISGSGLTVSTVRSSNLVKILGGAFSVSSVIRFISHIRISREDLDITLSTLRLTAKIARLKPIKMKEDVKYQTDVLVHRLQDEISALKKELLLNDLFCHQETQINISKSRMEQIYRSILNFLNGNISDYTLFSVSQAQVLLKCIKDLHNRLSVKEVEVEQLKEMYDSLLNTVSQVTLVSTDDQVATRKRTRNSSQIILEVEESKKTPDIEVGSIDKSTSGVPLGPYAKKEVDPEKTLQSAKESTASKYVAKIDDQNVERVKDFANIRQLFECFLKEEKEYAKIKEKFDKNEKTLASVRQRFSDTIDSYFQTRRNLNDAHVKLSKQCQMRYILESENRNGNEQLLKVERAIERDILCYQKILVSLEEEVNQAQEELCRLSNQYTEFSAKLKSGFEQYCKGKNLFLNYTDRLMKMLLEPTKTESQEIIRRQFNKFQRTILRISEEAESTKRARFETKIRCNSADM